jgi:hypothetical protein
MALLCALGILLAILASGCGRAARGVTTAGAQINSLRGRVRHITLQGGQYRVEIDCGLFLVALAGVS